MKNSKFVILIALALMLSSCYHAQITTDRTPSSQVIDKPWAHSFLYGLVPPNVVETASECPNGLARVETKISFLNGLASSITFGIYTPMHITVTCAAGGTAAAESLDGNKVIITKTFSDEEKAEAFQNAAKKSIDTGKAVYIVFNQ